MSDKRATVTVIPYLGQSDEGLLPGDVVKCPPGDYILCPRGEPVFTLEEGKAR